MNEALQRAWLRRGVLAWLLRPVSLLFGLLSAARRVGFRAGWFKAHRMRVPVIVVGNVVAGGSGKTPVVIAIVKHLRSRGILVGVVSRGYGRAGTECVEVSGTSDAREAGDEPLLIARASGVPVFVAPARADAARGLLAAHPETQVIVCDDGLQHYALERDIEICVFDDRGTGNGWLLPSGPLREHWPRQADLVLRTANATNIKGHVVIRALAEVAVRGDGATRALESLKDGALTAIAGIAGPSAFFEMLSTSGLEVKHTVALPDHANEAQYAAAIQDLATDTTLICTEKDAVKLWKQRPDAWAVPLVLQIAPAFWFELDRLLDTAIEAKLSSGHGSETA